MKRSYTLIVTNNKPKYLIKKKTTFEL